MSVKLRQATSQERKEIRETKAKLLDTQEALAVSMEESDKLKASLLNTQDLVAQLAEKGGL